MTSIATSLSELGFAPVLVMVARDAKDQADGLCGHFTAHAESQLGLASLATSAADDSRPTAVDGARVYPNLGVVYGTVDRAGLTALRADSRVRSVKAAPQLSLIRPVRRQAAASTSAPAWGITAMGIPELWEQGLTGAGVAVAHLDSGIDASHPAVRACIAGFAEFDVSGRQVPGAAPRDSDEIDGHGTHTAATLAGRAVRRRRVGVAPGAMVHSALVIEGGDVVARVLGGMDWALGQGVRVLSMSLGIRGLVNDFLGVVDVLRDSGVLPVMAVGNEGPGTSRSPGNYPKALSVGAHDENMTVAGFSSSQRFARRSQPVVPDLTAPGVDIVSARAGGGWHALSGSSMATPHVAGLAALLLEAEPGATVARLERAIQASAVRGEIDPARGGRGAANGPRALASLLSRR